MATSALISPSISDSVADEFEKRAADDEEVSNTDVSETVEHISKKYLSGLSNQFKGSVLCLIGILTLTPDTLLLRRLQYVPDFTVQFYRNLIFGLTIFIFILAVSGRKAVKIFKDIGAFGWFAGLLWGASNMLFTAAIQGTAVANVLVIVASNTVFSSIFSYLLLGELIPIRMFITSAICFGAIALIFSGSVGGGSGDTLGSILAVITSITQGLFFSLIRYKYAKGEDVSNMDILCYNVVAAIGVCVVSLALNPDLRDVHGIDILYLFVDGIIVLAGGFGLLTIGPGYIPANEVSLYFLIETILGPVLVFLGGYEAPPKFTLYGGICLIFALALNSILAIREENMNNAKKLLDIENKKNELRNQSEEEGIERVDEIPGVEGGHSSHTECV